jgi:hypothetical protein
MLPTDPLVFKAMLTDALGADDVVSALGAFIALCSLFGDLARGELASRVGVVRSAPSAADRWLTPSEAAPLLGVSPKTLQRRWRSLPFCHPALTKRGFRVSQRGLREYMNGAAGQGK